MQNRNAAATSRQKKQRYMTEMETRIAKLMLEQTQLLQDVQALQQENVQLKQRVLQKTSQAPVKVEVPEVAVQEVKAEVTAEVVEGQKVKTERVEREHVSLGHAPNAQPSLVSTGEVCVVGVSGGVGVMAGGAVGVDGVSGVSHESAALASPQWKTPHTPSTSPSPLPSLLLLTLFHYITSTLLLTLCSLTATHLSTSPRHTHLSYPTSTSTHRTQPTTTSSPTSPHSRTTRPCGWTASSCERVPALRFSPFSLLPCR